MSTKCSRLLCYNNGLEFHSYYDQNDQCIHLECREDNEFNKMNFNIILSKYAAKKIENIIWKSADKKRAGSYIEE